MSTEEEAENSGDTPDEDLCVVCLLRRRQAAFIQCGHRVCCVPCAQRVEQGNNPLRPVCRQVVTSKTKKRAKRDFVGLIAMLDSPKLEITEDVADNILTHYEDSRDIAIVRCVSRVFNQAGKNVRSLRWVLREVDHENARKNLNTAKTLDDDGGETPGRNLHNNRRDRSETTTGDIEAEPCGPHSTRGNVASEEQDSWTGERNGADVHDASTSTRTGDESPNYLNGDRIEHDIAPEFSDSETACERATEDKSQITSQHVDVNGRYRASALDTSLSEDVSTGKRTGNASQNCLNGDRFKQDTDDSGCTSFSLESDVHDSLRGGNSKHRAGKESSCHRQTLERATDKIQKGTSRKTTEYMDGHSSSGEIVVGKVQDSLTCQQNGNDSQMKLDRGVAHTHQDMSGQTIRAGSNSKSDNGDVMKEASEVRDSRQRSQKQLKRVPLLEILDQDLKSKPCIQQLRIEIEPKLQSKTVPAEERQRCDFWLSDPLHLIIWVPSVSRTLQHLCIVDYGQQAIMKQSSILKILSQHCKRLKTIDLRNMFIDTKDCEQMPELTSFTLRCVKMNGGALVDISSKMEGLLTLALLGVFGIQTGCLSLLQLKVLCLGLSTKAEAVKLDLPSLSKLQLKMACPDKLCITAPVLKFIAFNLEVRKAFALNFINVFNVQELLYGASNFLALSTLVKGNRFLNKLFLDIPCMALGEDGKWLGVLKEVMLNIPNFKTLTDECSNLETLNIGPGLWHSMEINIEEVKNQKSWPPVKTLILHMIPHTLLTSLTLLNKFQTEMHNTLVNLEINIHTTSPVASSEFLEAIQDDDRGLNFKWKLWTKSLDFSCFTF